MFLSIFSKTKSQLLNNKIVPTSHFNRSQRSVCSQNTQDDPKSICRKLNDETQNVIYKFKENGSFLVQLNNPTKRNAFNLSMYQSIGRALRIASDNQQIKCVFFKGNRGFYSSGNDLSYLKDIPKDELRIHILKTISAMDDYINELIEIKKPIIAAVDGPAIGIGCSTLGLFDSIIASTRSEFLVPFSKIGLVPEGCSSYTFPRMIGSMRANKMLLFNHKLDAYQALDWGFISELVEKDFEEAVDKFENYVTTVCNSESIIEGKKLVRNDETREKLKKINQTEAELMKQFWQEPAYQTYLNKFYHSKEK